MSLRRKSLLVDVISYNRLIEEYRCKGIEMVNEFFKIYKGNKLRNKRGKLAHKGGVQNFKMENIEAVHGRTELDNW